MSNSLEPDQARHIDRVPNCLQKLLADHISRLRSCCCFSFLQETGIKLSEDEIQLLLEELDRDGDGEINYK